MRLETIVVGIGWTSTVAILHHNQSSMPCGGCSLTHEYGGPGTGIRVAPHRHFQFCLKRRPTRIGSHYAYRATLILAGPSIQQRLRQRLVRFINCHAGGHTRFRTARLQTKQFPM